MNRAILKLAVLAVVVGVQFMAPLTATVEAQPVPYGAPVLIEIPRIGVRAKIENLGISKSGILNAPRTPDRVGWYKNGTLPGQRGNAFMYGHLNTFTSTAVFWKLRYLRTGDLIIVTNDRKQKLTFKVTVKKTYPWNAAPFSQILGRSRAKHLNLMTCAGYWSSRQHNYSHRLVVFTDLVSIKSPGR